MRVLIVTGSLPPDRCGVGDYTACLYRRLAESRCVDAAVLTSVPKSGTLARDDPPNVLRSMPNWRLSGIWRFLKIIRHWNPDVIHVQYPTQGYGRGRLPWLIPRLARWLGKAVVQTWHEPYSRRSAVRLMIQARVPGAVVVVRPDYRERLHPFLHWALSGKLLRYISSASTLPVSELDVAQRNAMRARLLAGQQRLIVFFGFLYPHKRVELLFQIADPSADQIVIAGEVDDQDPYGSKIRCLAESPPWCRKATVTGFLPADEVAALLAVADAVVLPFESGGGDWNTSIHAATQQGTFVLTTSTTHHGYDARRNVFFAQPDDYDAMRTALAKHAGQRRCTTRDPAGDDWTRIADAHVELYRTVLTQQDRAS